MPNWCLGEQNLTLWYKVALAQVILAQLHQCMAPKKKAIPIIGGPQPNAWGYRAEAVIDKKLRYGPWRYTQNLASEDIRDAQRAAAAVAHEDRDSQIAAYDAVLVKLRSAEKAAREKVATVTS